MALEEKLVGLALNWIGGGSKPNPNDWKGWTYGDAKKWVTEDGDDPKNEAANILSFMSKPGFDIAHMYDDSFGYRAVTYAMINSKLQRNGFGPTSAIPDTNTGSFFDSVKRTGGSIFTSAAPAQPQPVKSSVSAYIWPLLGIAALITMAVSFFSKGKRRRWVIIALVSTLGLNAQSVSNNGIKQLRSDWNATSGVTSIRNKPSLASYMRNSDTSAMLGGYLRSGHLPGFLAPYATLSALGGYVPYVSANTVTFATDVPFVLNSSLNQPRLSVTGIGNFDFNIHGAYDLSIYRRFAISDAFGTQFSVYGDGRVFASGAISSPSYTGTLSTSAQPNVTSLGVLTSLTVSGSLGLLGVSEVKKSKQLFYDPVTKLVSYGDTSVGGGGGTTIDTAALLSGYQRSGNPVIAYDQPNIGSIGSEFGAVALKGEVQMDYVTNWMGTELNVGAPLVLASSLRFGSYATQTDTTAYKPMVMDASGYVHRFSRYPIPAGVVKVVDTLAMLSNYLRRTDVAANKYLPTVANLTTGTNGATAAHWATYSRVHSHVSVAGTVAVVMDATTAGVDGGFSLTVPVPVDHDPVPSAGGSGTILFVNGSTPIYVPVFVRAEAGNSNRMFFSFTVPSSVTSTTAKISYTYSYDIPTPN